MAGRRTHYLERGQGKPVVLIHGFNMDSNTWTRNIEPLAAHFKVYAPDLWGQGYSTRQPLDYGYELFEEQIQLFLEALNLPTASLVGHSMGGGTSIVFALRHRDLWTIDHDSLTEGYFENFSRYQMIDGTTQALLTMLRKDFFDKLEIEIGELGQPSLPKTDPSVLGCSMTKRAQFILFTS